MALLAVAAALLLPQNGALVPWRSLGGVRLGMTPAQVERQWGTAFGRCRGCTESTWYFNYTPFQPQGAAVSFSKGRVDAVWTLWKPSGWHLGTRIVLGAQASSLGGTWGALVTVPCGPYEARVLTRRGITTVLYVYADQLWGFGLVRANARPCR